MLFHSSVFDFFDLLAAFEAEYKNDHIYILRKSKLPIGTSIF